MNSNVRFKRRVRRRVIRLRHITKPVRHDAVAMRYLALVAAGLAAVKVGLEIYWLFQEPPA
jgi:hypothetical protein